MTTNTITRPTEATCPPWCTVEHGEGPEFHAGPNLTPKSPTPFRLWQADSVGARAGIVVAGELLTDAQAHELGMALVRAADVLRRARMEASR